MMNKKEKSLKYIIINIIVLAAAVFLFAGQYDVRELLSGISRLDMLVIVASAVIVHTVKALRLYVAIFFPGMKTSDYLKTYCKVTPVSAIFPFKTGELFRMYCYGELVGNLPTGVVVILLDRFMDTAALVTILFMVLLLNGGPITPLLCFLVVILFFMLIAYAVFPGIYQYWKKYILRLNVTPRKIRFLSFIDRCNDVYKRISNVTRGRGVILYFLSLIAWGIELGGIAAFNYGKAGAPLNSEITEYLMAALGAGRSVELRLFVVFSVILMIMLYAGLKIYAMFAERRK